MAIDIIDGFNVNKNVPIDTNRTIKATISERDAIPMGVRYEGMETRVIATKTKYVLEGGIANANWKPMVSSSIPDFAFSSIEEIRGLDVSAITGAVDVWLYPNKVYEWDVFSVVGDNGDTVLKPVGIADGAAGRFVLRTELALKNHTHTKEELGIGDVDDSMLVHKTGDETIEGEKEFSDVVKMGYTATYEQVELAGITSFSISEDGTGDFKNTLFNSIIIPKASFDLLVEFINAFDASNQFVKIVLDGQGYISIDNSITSFPDIKQFINIRLTFGGSSFLLKSYNINVFAQNGVYITSIAGMLVDESGNNVLPSELGVFDASNVKMYLPFILEEKIGKLLVNDPVDDENPINLRFLKNSPSVFSSSASIWYNALILYKKAKNYYCFQSYGLIDSVATSLNFNVDDEITVRIQNSREQYNPTSGEVELYGMNADNYTDFKGLYHVIRDGAGVKSKYIFNKNVDQNTTGVLNAFMNVLQTVYCLTHWQYAIGVERQNGHIVVAKANQNETYFDLTDAFLGLSYVDDCAVITDTNNTYTIFLITNLGLVAVRELGDGTFQTFTFDYAVSGGNGSFITYYNKSLDKTGLLFLSILDQKLCFTTNGADIVEITGIIDANKGIASYLGTSYDYQLSHWFTIGYDNTSFDVFDGFELFESVTCVNVNADIVEKNRYFAFSNPGIVIHDTKLGIVDHSIPIGTRFSDYATNYLFSVYDGIISAYAPEKGIYTKFSIKRNAVINPVFATYLSEDIITLRYEECGRWLVTAHNNYLTRTITDNSALEQSVNSLTDTVNGVAQSVATLEEQVQSLMSNPEEPTEPTEPTTEEAYTEVTHAQLLVLINSNTLEPFKKYCITDFCTFHKDPVTSHVMVGGGHFIYTLHKDSFLLTDFSLWYEPLVVTAISSNELSLICHSLLFPQDEIHYIPYKSQLEYGVLPFFDKGRIIYRRDRIIMLSAHLDWRNVYVSYNSSDFTQQSGSDSMSPVFDSCQNCHIGKGAEDVYMANCTNVTVGADSNRVQVESCYDVSVGPNAYNISLISVDLTEIKGGASSLKINNAGGLKIGSVADINIDGADGYVYGIEIKDYASTVFIGNTCTNISIGYESNSVFIFETCKNVKIGNNSSNVSIGSGCTNVSIGDDVVQVGIGASCNQISIADYSSSCSINNSSHISIGNHCPHVSLDFCKNINVGSQCQSLVAFSAETMIENINIAAGCDFGITITADDGNYCGVANIDIEGPPAYSGLSMAIEGGLTDDNAILTSNEIKKKLGVYKDGQGNYKTYLQYMDSSFQTITKELYAN